MAEMSQAESASTQAKAKESIYEVGFHLVPNGGEESVGPAVEAIRKAINDSLKSGQSDVEIVKESYPQKVTFAYTIERAEQGKREKFTEGYFGWIKFALKPEAERAQVALLQEKLRAMKMVLRYLVVATVREEESAQRTRAVFASDRLEGQTLHKPTSAPEKRGEVSEEELNKSIEALTQ